MLPFNEFVWFQSMDLCSHMKRQSLQHLNVQQVLFWIFLHTPCRMCRVIALVSIQRVPSHNSPVVSERNLLGWPAWWKFEPVLRLPILRLGSDLWHDIASVGYQEVLVLTLIDKLVRCTNSIYSYIAATTHGKRLKPFTRKTDFSWNIVLIQWISTGRVQKIKSGSMVVYSTLSFALSLSPIRSDVNAWSRIFLAWTAFASTVWNEDCSVCAPL